MEKIVLPLSPRILSKLEQIEKRYASQRFYSVCEIPMKYTQVKEHYRQAPLDVPSLSWENAVHGTKWGGNWVSAWFVGEFTLPEELDGKKVFLKAGTGAESLFIVNGEYKGVFDENHPIVMVDKSAKGFYKIALEAYSGHEHPGCMPTDEPIIVEDNCRIFSGTNLLLEREDVSKFVFDFMTLRSLMNSLDVNSLRKNVIMRELTKVYETVDMYPDETGEESWRPKLAIACKIMEPLLKLQNGPTMPYMGIIGHSHMDTAWLWPLSETWRKCARTFSSILNLMDQYPEFTFIQSSPAQTEKIEELYPSIFENIKDRVKEGKYEPNGGMWVEPDCNIPSGESFVRQILFAQEYTKKKFNYTADTLWMPDVFGYSANLPQVLSKSGIKYFCTTKMSWNDTTRHPYDTFIWKGIDGSSVVSHFNLIHCWPDPATFINSWNWVQHKTHQNSRLISYGFGDGGGGPMNEMIEVARRCTDLEGCPRSSHTTVTRYMDSILESNNPLPEWSGELYLELHRGTLTSVSAIKKGNRKCEFMLRDAEIASVLAKIKGFDYPKEKLNKIWKDLLVNQFHDILPGSSIAQVNDLAIETFDKCLKEAEIIRDNGLKEACLTSDNETDKYMIFNTLSWKRTGEFIIDGVKEGLIPNDSNISSQWFTDLNGEKKIAINGFDLDEFSTKVLDFKNSDSQKTISPFKYNENTLETPFYKIEFDKIGRIISLWDKEISREIVKKNGALNTILLGEDVPEVWDNWDIDRDQRNKMITETRLAGREVTSDGLLQFRIRSKYKIGSTSTLIQDCIFHSNSRQIDFENKLDWKEKHKLMKVGFDLNLLTDFSRSEIQYGYVERPTHTNQMDDVARFEACNHKWTDLSENGFGVAILNDCKYGIGINDSTLELTLIKSGTHPDPRGDEGIHFFNYALLPHNNSFGAVSVIKPSYEFNSPIIVNKANDSTKEISSLISINKDNIILETIKLAEDEDGIIIRFYDADKTGNTVKINLNFDFKEIIETNLMEEEIEKVLVKDKEFETFVNAFEIKTFRIRL